MACTDCFNGCNPITPDKCVKYTGVDQLPLNIKNGDTLFAVDDKIILKILDVMVGTGIIPSVSPTDICSQVMGNMPGTSPYDVNDYITAILKTVCKNATDIAAIDAKITAINSPYVMSCVTGVTAGPDQSDTHKVLQAVINSFCTLKAAYDAFVLEVPTLYVKKSDINSYIQAYVASTAPTNAVSNNMIPYVAVEFYDPAALTYFDSSGSGIDKTSTGGKNWSRIFLCNGQHGTPDKRGVVAVGVTTVPGGGVHDPKVNPQTAGNPNYVLSPPVITGSNTVTLNANQIPSHKHTATVAINDPGHTHTYNEPVFEQKADYSTNEKVWRGVTQVKSVSNSKTGLTGSNVTVTIGDTGGNESHSNIQPVLPCYYIMYIP